MTNTAPRPNTGCNDFPLQQRGTLSRHVYVYVHADDDRAREQNGAISAKFKGFRRPTVKAIAGRFHLRGSVKDAVAIGAFRIGRGV